MDAILDELRKSLPDAHEVVRVVVRLLAALLAGTVIGLQREHSGAPAGLRTHMLVCMGVALFVIVSTDVGMEHDALSRVIQGIAIGLGRLGTAAIGMIFVWFVLAVVIKAEARIRG
jgi:putative Mg2+ transporter-C (MgtC) family protein